MSELTIEAGQTVYVVDEVGGTFVFMTQAYADIFAEMERDTGADGVVQFTGVCPRTMTCEQAADYFASVGDQS